MPASQKDNKMPDTPMQRAVRTNLTVRSDTYNAEAGTIDLVYATGTPVRRNWYTEVLEISEGAIDSSRMDGEAVYLIRDHEHRSEHYGRVIAHRVEGGVAIATIKLTGDPAKQGMVGDILSGVIRSVSVAYMITQDTETENEDGTVTVNVTRWMPYEISLTPIPADIDARFRSDVELSASGVRDRFATATTKRSDPVPAAPAPDPADPEPAQVDPDPAPQSPDTTGDTTADNKNAEGDAPDAPLNDEPLEAEMSDKTTTINAEDVVAAERARSSEIRALVRRHGLDDAFVTAHLDGGSSIDAARSAALDAIAARSAPDVSTAISGTRATVGKDERETLIERAQDALYSRVTGEKPSDAGREMRGMSMVDMARSFTGKTGYAAEVVKAALSQRSGMHTTSDFALVLGNTLERTLRRSYEAAPATYMPFIRETEVPNFNPVSRIQTGDAPELDLVLEGAEYTYGTMGTASEKLKVDTYGKVIAISRQAIVNDDLGAFTNVAAKFGNSAASKKSKLVYGLLSANGKMSDGKNLFSAAHGNDLTFDDLNVAALSAIRAAGLRQKTIDGDAMDVIFTQLIVGPDLWLAAQKILGSISATSTGDYNPHAGSMTIVVDSRVSDGQFFVAASPSSIDTIELAYLNGERGVQTETRDGFLIDGVEVKASLDIGAGVIDFRGLARGTIASET